MTMAEFMGWPLTITEIKVRARIKALTIPSKNSSIQ